MSEENKWYFEYCAICDNIFKYAKQKKRKFFQAWMQEQGILLASRVVLLRCGNCFNYNKNPFQAESYKELKNLMEKQLDEMFIAKYGKGIDIEDLR